VRAPYRFQPRACRSYRVPCGTTGDDTGYWDYKHREATRSSEALVLALALSIALRLIRAVAVALALTPTRTLIPTLTTRSDLGHNCRECRGPFRAIGEPMTERRGARLTMRYHAECFSGFADPRSQAITLT